MREILQDWRTAATDGVNLFTTTVLSQRIDDLESGSWTTFIGGLIGNTIWAAAAFTTGGAAFAVSMVGISVAAAPTLPGEGKNLIPAVQKAMQDHVYALYAALDRTLHRKAKNLIDSLPGIGRYHAIARFVQASVKPELFSDDGKYTTIPTLALDRIRDLYVERAKAAFDQFVQLEKDRIEPLGVGGGAELGRLQKLRQEIFPRKQPTEPQKKFPTLGRPQGGEGPRMQTIMPSMSAMPPSSPALFRRRWGNPPP